MKCPNCHIENPVENKFCKECGTALLTVCDRCGHHLQGGDKFCGKCGHDLRKHTEIRRFNYSEPQAYTPKFLADKILTNRSTIEGERKLVTVLFADVADYTSVAEKLDPEDVHEIMDGCFSILMNEVHQYEGTINQFTGDGIMALFGAPVAHEDHAQRACYAALAIQNAFDTFSEDLKNEYDQNFKMRIGLNSGHVVVGSIGDNLRMDYTAVGDTTNLASRIQTNAEPGTVLISENTYRFARDFFKCISLGKVEVKGKAKHQEIYQLVGTSDIETRFDASVTKGLTKFVGRTNSMALLKAAFKKAKSGAGQVVGVVGEAGVGKSRLLLELRNKLPQKEYVYLEGRCLHYGNAITYLPIRGILKTYFEINDEDRRAVIKKKIEQKILQVDESLADIIPPLQELFSLKVDDENFANMAPKEKRVKIFEAIFELMIQLSLVKPLVIAIEDLHWIDKTSEEFLDYLIGRLTGASIMLILLYRSEYDHQWGSKSYYTRVGLNQLGVSSSFQMVQAILGDAEMNLDLQNFFGKRVAGNPLFIEEFTYALLEDGYIKREKDKFILSQKATDIQVPNTIQGIIAARMDRLESNLKRIMQLASVIGREFAYRILDTITHSQNELKSDLLELQGLEFIYEKRLFPELEYLFKHALIQEFSYNSLLKKRRKEIHHKIGEAIEALYAGRIEEFYEILAYHYSKSDNFEKAYLYLRLSGDNATKKFSNWEAFGFYKAAFAMLDMANNGLESEQNKIEILRLMAIPIQLLGYPEESLQFMKKGEEISHNLQDSESLIFFYGVLGSYYTIRGGDPSLGTKYSEKSFDEAEKIQDIEIMASVSSRLCGTYIIAGEPFKAAVIAPKVIKVIEKQKRQQDFFGMGNNVYAALNSFYGHSLGFIGEFEKGEQFCQKGLEFGKKVDTLNGLALGEFLFGYLYMHRGDGDNAKNHFKACIKYCEKGGALIWLGLAWTGFGIGHFFANDIEASLKFIKKGIGIQKQAGIPYFLSLHYLCLGMVYFELNDLHNSEDAFSNALEFSKMHNERVIEGGSRYYLGAIRAQMGKLTIEKAETAIHQGINILDNNKIKPWTSIGYYTLGRLQTHFGQNQNAIGNLKIAEKNFRQMQMTYWLAKTQDILGRL